MDFSQCSQGLEEIRCGVAPNRTRQFVLRKQGTHRPVHSSLANTLTHVARALAKKFSALHPKVHLIPNDRYLASVIWSALRQSTRDKVTENLVQKNSPEAGKKLAKLVIAGEDPYWEPSEVTSENKVILLISEHNIGKFVTEDMPDFCAIKLEISNINILKEATSVWLVLFKDVLTVIDIASIFHDVEDVVYETCHPCPICWNHLAPSRKRLSDHLKTYHHNIPFLCEWPGYYIAAPNENGL